MKTLFFTAAAAVTLLGLSGCASHYEMTMQNGTRIITVGEPSYDDNTGLLTYETRFSGIQQIPQADVKGYEKKPY